MLPASAVVNIDWVTIGDPNNLVQSAANRTHSFGGDGYGTDSQNYYGINDMAGNVYEWNDLTGASGSSRGLRGGSFEL